MKRYLAVMLVLMFVLLSSMIGAESMKTLKIPGTDFAVSVPEKAPDFISFPTQMLGSKKFANGNAIAVAESMNKEQTVDVIVVLAKVGNKVSVIAMQVTYCHEGLDKIDTTKEHPAEFYEDSVFMKSGKLTGVLMRVAKLHEYVEFSRYIEGTEV